MPTVQIFARSKNLHKIEYLLLVPPECKQNDQEGACAERERERDHTAKAS